MKLTSLGECSVKYTPSIQSSVRFWEDIWLGDCALSSRYPQVYNSCRNKNILLSEVIATQGEGVQFTDILVGVSRIEWNELLSTLSHLSFTHEIDKLAWRWDSTGSFSVKSIYHLLNYRGVLTRQPLLLWSLPIPPKIRIFIWLTFRNRILTKTNLRKKGWEGSVQCLFCSHDESVDHLFLHCRLVQQIWYWLGCTQQFYQQWHTMADVFEFALSLPPQQRQAFLLVFCAACWTLWKHRNEVIFQQISIKSARSLIYLTISLVLYWIGNKKIKQPLRDNTQHWLPQQETMDAIPIRVVWPGEEESVSSHPDDTALLESS